MPLDHRPLSLGGRRRAGVRIDEGQPSSRGGIINYVNAPLLAISQEGGRQRLRSHFARDGGDELKTLMRQEDVRYFQQRAEQEIVRAQAADHPAAVQAHYALANHYLDMVNDSPVAPSRPRNFLQS